MTYLRQWRGETAAVPSPPQQRALVDRLMGHAISELETDLLPRGNVAVCGADASWSTLIRRVVHEAGGVLHHIGDTRRDLQWVHQGFEEIDLMIVDADFLGDVGDTIDFCMRVRRLMPQMPLVLISSEVSGDDFTCERMGACDVTLKAGFSRPRLEQAILTAYRNNAFYQKTRN